MSASYIKPRQIRVEELWFSTVLIATVATQLAESALLQYKFTYFTTGIHTGMALSSLIDWFLYEGLSISYDIFFISIAVSIICIVTRHFCQRSYVAFLTLIFPVAITWGFTGIEYRVFSYFRDTLDFHLLRSLGGGHLGDTLRYVSPEIWSSAILAFFLIAVCIVIFYILKERPNLNLPSPILSRRSITVITLVCLFITITGGYVSRQMPKLRFGLEKKLSFLVLTSIADKVTDFDLDGYGLFTSPYDPAPFSAQIYPYALDFPDNGVDENGFAGDLPQEVVMRKVEPTSPKVQTRRSVILIVLETMRWDVLHATVKGREVTPNLRQLAAEGLSVPIALSHNPVSEITLQNLFLGHTCPGHATGSIFDDFAALGYETSIFSAADESYGGTDKIVGLDRVQTFYDARTEPDFRMHRGNLPMSRMISASHLNLRIFEFLERRDPSRPLFLYINYQEAHFPYHSSMHENIVNDHPIPRHKVSPTAADWLQRTYLNAVANTDLAIGLLVERLQEMGIYDNTVLLIVGDHGEELFDDGHGYLGHGFALNDLQTRVPFILVHGGIDVRYPIGLSEIRWILQRTLQAPKNAGPGRAILDNNKHVFQYIGYLRRPRQIGLAGIDGRILYDFKRGRILTADGKWHPLNIQSLGIKSHKEATSLIHTWEACQYVSSSATHSKSR